MPRSKKIHDYLIERLKDPQEATLYFNAILEECKECDEQESLRLVLAALRDIAQAQGGVTKLAKRAKLEPKSITKTFSAVGHTKISTIITIKDALLSPTVPKK